MTKEAGRKDGRNMVIVGDCVEVMNNMDENSIDAIVCDPPYGLEFMGQEWDAPWKNQAVLEKAADAGGFQDGDGGNPFSRSRIRYQGTTGFRRQNNPADAERDSVFGRTTKTSPEYESASKKQGGVTARRDRSAERDADPVKAKYLDHNVAYDRDPNRLQAWHESWARAAFRVLKPGGHLIAFGGTRTSHRLACAVEDAGFEIRDALMWVYGSG